MKIVLKSQRNPHRPKSEEPSSKSKASTSKPVLFVNASQFKTKARNAKFAYRVMGQEECEGPDIPQTVQPLLSEFSEPRPRGNEPPSGSKASTLKPFLFVNANQFKINARNVTFACLVVGKEKHEELEIPQVVQPLLSELSDITLMSSPMNSCRRWTSSSV